MEATSPSKYSDLLSRIDFKVQIVQYIRKIRLLNI